MKDLTTKIWIVLVVNLLLSQGTYGEVLERIVAYVDDYAITLSEVKEMQLKSPKPMTYEETIETMINRVLLLKEAKKMKLDPPETNQINEYIDIKIRSLVFIREEQIQSFYEVHSERFKGIPLSTVREQIEKYLIEEETNRRLKEHLNHLRQGAEIKIQPYLSSQEDR